MSVIGNPALLLILVGFLNGLIVPISVTVMLLACRRKDIVGADYKHPIWLIIVGIIIVLATAYLSIMGFAELPGRIAELFN
jgi:Mn2+/Fe2+ NRAMP family transporter